MKSYEQLQALGNGEHKRNLQDFINELRGLKPEQFKMFHWKTGEGCNTVCCIGGWFEAFYGEARGDDGAERAEQKFGISSNDWGRLCHMDFAFSMVAFDKLPADQRKQSMIRVLEIALETGAHDWRVAMVETVGPDVAQAVHMGSYIPPEYGL